MLFPLGLLAGTRIAGEQALHEEDKVKVHARVARVGRRFAACSRVFARLASFTQTGELVRRLEHVQACPWEPADPRGPTHIF